MNRGIVATNLVLAAIVLLLRPARRGRSCHRAEDAIRTAVTRALPLLERASAGSADQRTCFTCHSQALPVFAIVESQRRGFHANAENLKRQIDHTYNHLRRGRKSYEEGKGQGGGVDTAGYALWTLEDGQQKTDEVVTMVTDWLLQKQHKDGYWKQSSNRPPSEASDFTTTYLALRALTAFGTDQQSDPIEQANAAAASWLADAEGKGDGRPSIPIACHSATSTFPIRSPPLLSLGSSKPSETTAVGRSRPDMNSDAYATATALYALRDAGAIDNDDVVWKRAVALSAGRTAR